MIKKMLKRGQECDTYLTHVCRHLCSGENLMKISNIEFPANTGAFKSTSAADERHSVAWELYILSFQQVFSAPAMSTDTSQVGVALFPSFWHFYH